jgi:hypothetical protein
MHIAEEGNRNLVLTTKNQILLSFKEFKERNEKHTNYRINGMALLPKTKSKLKKFLHLKSILINYNHSKLKTANDYLVNGNVRL